MAKTRKTQVVKKLVFLFVFALVVLAYIATPFATYTNGGANAVAAARNLDARGKGKAKKKGKKGKNKGNNANNGKNNNGGINASTRIDSTILNVVLETDTLQFSDSAGNVVDFGTLRTGQAFNIIASDTTNNTTQTISAQLLGNNIALITLPSNKQQQILFANVKSSCLSGNTTFSITIPGSATQQAQCLDRNSASVRLLGSPIPTTIVFPQSPTI